MKEIAQNTFTDEVAAFNAFSGLIRGWGNYYAYAAESRLMDSLSILPKVLCTFLADRCVGRWGGAVSTVEDRDSYKIYTFLRRLGYQHEQVNHSRGEYARGEVHINGVKGMWSLLPDHLRLHRGVSKSPP